MTRPSLPATTSSLIAITALSYSPPERSNQRQTSASLAAYEPFSFSVFWTPARTKADNPLGKGDSEATRLAAQGHAASRLWFDSPPLGGHQTFLRELPVLLRGPCLLYAEAVAGRDVPSLLGWIVAGPLFTSVNLCPGERFLSSLAMRFRSFTLSVASRPMHDHRVGD